LRPWFVNWEQVKVQYLPILPPYKRPVELHIIQNLVIGKKYFILIPDVMIHAMADMLKNWKCEQRLHLEIMEYKKEINESLPKDSDEIFDLEFHTDYLEFLNQASASIEKLQKKLTEKNTNN
jgi:hypothetical protein